MIGVYYAAVINLVTFVLYAADKRKAVKGKWRISEKTLLTLSVLGGGIGGLAAMELIRHKTKHWYFWVCNFVGMAVCIAVIAFANRRI